MSDEAERLEALRALAAYQVLDGYRCSDGHGVLFWTLMNGRPVAYCRHIDCADVVYGRRSDTELVEAVRTIQTLDYIAAMGWLGE